MFDAICYIPKFEQAWHNVLTKKISFEVALFLWMDLVTKPYVPKRNDYIAIPMADRETLFGSTVAYYRDSKWCGTYQYQSSKWLHFESAHSREKWILTEFIYQINEYLIDIISDNERWASIQRWKQLCEIILRCWLKKRRHINAISQNYLIQDNGYLMNPKTNHYLLSLDQFIVDSDNLDVSAIVSMGCAEYVWRELRYCTDETLMDECDQFVAYAWEELFIEWIEQLALHAIEVIELQKRELALWFEYWDLKDEYAPIRS